MAKTLIFLALMLPMPLNALMITPGDDIDFGEVIVGIAATLTATFEVECDSVNISCSATGAAVDEGGPFEIVGFGLQPIDGGSMGTWFLAIRFIPPAVGDFTAQAVVSGIGLLAPQTSAAVSVSGRGVRSVAVPGPGALALLSFGLIGLARRNFGMLGPSRLLRRPRGSQVSAFRQRGRSLAAC